MDRRWISLVFVLAAAWLLAAGPRSPALAAGGTPVCGSLPAGTTTWSGLGSPYLICASGVSVPAGATLKLDATLGSVVVRAQGVGGLTVGGGTVQTVATSAAQGVSFSGPAAGAGSWAGITVTGGTGAAPSGSVTLAYVEIDAAVDGLSATWARTLDIEHVTVDRASGYGIHVIGGTPVLKNSTVTNSGTATPPAPAVRVESATFGLGTGQTVDGNQGASNALDVLVLGGSVTNSFTWVTPTNSAGLHSLGYATTGLRQDGPLTLTIPAGAVVKGGGSSSGASITVAGGTFDAGAGGATFASLQDNGVGLALCPSIITPDCSSGSGFAGIELDTSYGSSPPATVSQGNGVVRSAVFRGKAGFIFNSAATSGPGGLGYGLSVLDTTMTGMSTGITGTSTGTLQVAGGSIRGLVPLQVQAGAVNVNGLSVEGLASGIDLTGPQVSVTGSTVSGDRDAYRQRFPGAGIRVAGATNPMVRDDTVTGSGWSFGTLTPAFDISGSGLTVGPGGGIDRNQGADNAFDAVLLNGGATGGFTWKTATARSSVGSLGYLAGRLRVDGPGTVTVPAGAVVKGTLELAGTTLDASAGGAVFTGTTDASAGLPCPSGFDPVGSACQRTIPAGPFPDRLRFSPGPGGSQGNGSIAGASIRDGQISATSTATSTLGSATAGLVLSNVTLDRGAVNVPTLPLLMTGGSISGEPATALTGGSMTVTGVHIGPPTGPPGNYVAGLQAAGPGPIHLQDNTIDGAFGPGIAVSGSGALTVVGNDIRHSGLVGGPQAAIVLGAVRLGIGPGLDVDGNVGAGNGFDAIEFSGEVASDLTWITPTNSATRHPLGYLPDDLTVSGNHTFTVPAGAVVKVGSGKGITLAGARLDATAGGAVFTSFADDHVGIPTCAQGASYPVSPRPTSCDSDPLYFWTGIAAHADPASGARGSIALVDTRLAHAKISSDSGATTSAGSDHYGFLVDGLTLDHAAIDVTGSPVSISGLDLETSRWYPLASGPTDGVHISGSSGNVVRDSAVRHTNGHGLSLDNASADVADLELRDDGTFRSNSWLPEDLAALSAANGGAATVTCSRITGDANGVELGARSSVADSDLYGSTAPAASDTVGPRYDVRTTGPLSARHNWWGQPGGPVAGQIDDPSRVDASDPLSTPSPCAPAPPAAASGVTASGSNTSATVRWTPPAGRPISGFTVSASPGGASVAAPEDASSAVVSGLSNGTTYTFTVTARNVFGIGPASAPSNSVTPAAPSPAPSGNDPGTGGAGSTGSSGTPTNGSPTSGVPGSGTGTDPTSPAPTPNRSGYWLLDAAGTVYAFGDAPYLGGATLPAGRKASGLEPTPSGSGYWVVDDGGHVSTSGDAPYLGGASGRLLVGESVTGLSRTRSGQGYWLFTTRGRALPFGDAPFLGDMSGTRLNAPVVGSISTATGGGYFMVASDGGIFAFGDAQFVGSMGGRPLAAPVTALVPNPTGAGYWLVASDGGVFAFGAPFRGSMGGQRLNAPVSGMVPFGDGYLMVAADGGIFDFSDRPFSGSLGAHPPARPVVSVATLG